METLGNKIKFYRKKKGLTQKQLANYLGMKHANTITKIEKDLFFPKYANLYAISRYFEVSLDELCSSYLKNITKKESIHSQTKEYNDLIAKLSTASMTSLDLFYKVLLEYLNMKDSISLSHDNENNSIEKVQDSPPKN